MILFRFCELGVVRDFFVLFIFMMVLLYFFMDIILFVFFVFGGVRSR